jgi:hypothetical protein
MKFDDKRLASWDVCVEEVSAGVYRVFASDNEGHTVEITGEDPDMMLVECARAAGAQMGKAS